MTNFILQKQFIYLDIFKSNYNNDRNNKKIKPQLMYSGISSLVETNGGGFWHLVRLFSG